MELTPGQVEQRFLEHLAGLVNYWYKLEHGIPAHEDVLRYKLQGLAFTILSAIDGSTGDLPKFILAPDPHPDDKDYRKNEGLIHYPENLQEIACDISGSLHEKFFAVVERVTPKKPAPQNEI